MEKLNTITRRKIQDEKDKYIKSLKLNELPWEEFIEALKKLAVETQMEKDNENVETRNH